MCNLLLLPDDCEMVMTCNAKDYIVSEGFDVRGVGLL